MKGIMLVIVIAFLLSTFLMYEGRGTRRTPGRNADGSMTDYEVAQINGRSLMRSELERRLRNYLENYGSRNAASLDMAAIYQTVLDQAVLESQMAKEVDERGIRVSDAEAEQAMKNYADRYFPTRETFYQSLAQSGIRIEDYKRTLARQMANEQLIRTVIGDVEVSEDKAIEFYDTMKNLIYNKPEGFMIHLADFRTSADAEALRERIVSGDDWTKIVSDDELASSDLINITREPVFLPESALRSGTLSALNSLDVGQISPVFEVASFDFAVGLKTEKVSASVTPYDEVSSDIRILLRQQEERQRLNDYEESLMSKAQLVINDQSLFARASQDEEPEENEEEITPEISFEEVEEVEESADNEPEYEISIVEVSDDNEETEPETTEIIETVEVIETEKKSDDETEKIATSEDNLVEDVKISEESKEPEIETTVIEEKEEKKVSDDEVINETIDEISEEPIQEAVVEEIKIEENLISDEISEISQEVVEIVEETKEISSDETVSPDEIIVSEDIVSEDITVE